MLSFFREPEIVVYREMPCMSEPVALHVKITLDVPDSSDGLPRVTVSAEETVAETEGVGDSPWTTTAKLEKPGVSAANVRSESV